MKRVLLFAPMSSIHERFNIVNIKIFEKLQFETHIVANFELSKHDQNYQKKLNHRGIITHQFEFVRSSLIKNIKMIPKIKELLRTENFDIVHCHTETGGILMRFSINANKNSKYLYTPHGMSFYKGSSLKSQIIYYPIEKWICNKMNANLGMNSEEFEVFKKWNKDTAQFIHGIGVDVKQIQNSVVNKDEKRKEFDIPVDAKLILSVGELNENKNHRVILKAMSQIQNSNLYYMICGEGEKKDALLNLAEELNLAKKLIMPGYRYDVKEIYKIADIFAFPSFHEGLSVSMMEAMAVGLPIVCSKIRGNVDLIKDGEGGFLLEPTDVDGFKSAIVIILKDKQLTLSMKNTNMENIRSFSIEQVERETQEIYKGVLDN